MKDRIESVWLLVLSGNNLVKYRHSIHLEQETFALSISRSMLDIDLLLICRLNYSLFYIPHFYRTQSRGLKGALIKDGITKMKIWKSVVFYL